MLAASSFSSLEGAPASSSESAALPSSLRRSTTVVPGHVAQDQFNHTPEVGSVLRYVDDLPAVFVGETQVEPPYEVRFASAGLADDRQEEQARVRREEVLEELLFINESSALSGREVPPEHLAWAMCREKYGR